ncbi:MAG: DNA-protecting protein DprA [Gemmatimonadetes bacterium]|nr:DNA-protecting protein DprA [Gemmatimonadota bacterium]
MELHRDDPRYPAALRDLPDPPRTLWARGELALLDRPCVAIVGTRRATAYAERVARELARALARGGACVISGLARGVDVAAHRAALDVDGATCAVLGTGLDVAYPKGHAALQQDIGVRGLVLSELPPSLAAHGGSFPRRNRIIAALARVTVVVEAGVKSGALITAAHALDLNRTVAAVPGPIDIPQAQGSNELLRDGACFIASVADALALLGLTAPARVRDLPAEGSERALWDALAAGHADLDTLSSRARLPAHEAMAAVSALELRGLVECALSGEIRRL